MSKIFLKVRPFRETAGYCGPASLKILLSYYGVDKSEKQLAKLCKTKKDLGTSGENIKSAAEKLGFKVKIKDNSSFKDIESWLKMGAPVIVDWFTNDGHYSVAAGLDDKFIYLQDPELGRMRKLERKNFMTVWFDFKGKYIKPNELIIRQIIAIYK